MNLGQCIANLLRQYPEVAVPGIGVFRKKTVSASFDREMNVYSPPSSYIHLIEGEGNDALLTDYLKAQAQISDTAAARLLEEKVRDLLATIQRHGKVLLAGLGYLISDGARVAFKPFETDGYLFRPIPELRPAAAEAEIISDAIELEDTVVPVDAKADVAESRNDVETAEPVVAVEDELEAGDARGGRTAWWVVAAVLLVAISAAGGWAWLNRPEWFAGFTRGGTTNEVARPADNDDASGPAKGMPEATQLSLTDSVAQPVNSAAMPPADSAVADVSGASTDNVAAAKPTVTYEIIVGSFATMAQAERYVREMRAKGYEVEAIDSRMPGNRKKISWGSFASEEEAYRELVRVQKTFEPDAWIAKVFHD